MGNEYEDLENRFDCACKDVVKKLSTLYKSDYQSGGPQKLSAFFELVQEEFDTVESDFIRENKVSADTGALHAIRSIAKSYAKKCLEDYGRVL